jgi:transcriptional regulator with XRE-family HTH domain
MRVVIEGYEEAVVETLQTVATNLRWRREQLDLSFRDLSQLTGMDTGQLNRIFKGTREWYPSSLVKLGFALDCSPADFWMPHDLFVERYEEKGVDSPLVLRLSRDSRRSSSSSEGEKAPKGAKDSPFCKPLSDVA